MLLHVIFLIAVVSPIVVFSEEAVPLINEVLTANGSTIHDEDEDYRDWLEIFNLGDSPVNLEGYGLSDDEADLFRWVFPSIILEPGEHLMVFASGKNRTILPDHFETVIEVAFRVDILHVCIKIMIWTMTLFMVEMLWVFQIYRHV